MDKVNKYKQIASETILEVGSSGRGIDDLIKTHFIQDHKTGHYLLFSDGWRKSQRFYGCYTHIEVRDNGKVWLHYDGTDAIIAEILLEKGIPKSDIVLGFHPPTVRPDTDFAIG